MQGFLIEKFGSLILPMILGPVVYFVMANLKKVVSFVGNLNPTLQRGAVVLIAAAIASLAGLTGTDLACLHTATGCSLSDLDETTIKTIIGAGGAMLLHNFRQAPPRP